MEYRRLGKSGLQVSAMGLGAIDFGRRIDEQASIAVVREAMEQGITMIDTANVYGNGRSEEYVGKSVKGLRDKVILATKAAYPVAEGPYGRGTSRLHIMEEVEKSLRRLETDHIDLYQIHRPDQDTPIEETLRAMDDLVRQGKVRYIGCSGFATWQMCEAQWTSRVLNLNSFISVQPQYSLLQRGIEAELMPFCQVYGLGIIPYSPLAGGFLSGKYRVNQPPPEGARLAGTMGARTLTEENFALLASLEKFAASRGHTMLELAIGWLLAKPQVTTVIAGATRPEQVRANVAAASAWRLTVEEVQKADELTQACVSRPWIPVSLWQTALLNIPPI